MLSTAAMDFARRAWDHSFPFDPIVRTLMDTDFYKILMAQMIQEKHFNDHATFALSNRLGIALDAKYIRFRPDSGPPGNQVRLELDPLLVSAGVRLRW